MAKKKTKLIERPTLVVDEKKVKKVEADDTNVITQMPLDSGGITQGSFGSKTNFEKAKILANRKAKSLDTD